MNIDQVYDELYGVIDKNKAADAATQNKVAALEETVSTQGTTIATHTGQIAALQEAIPEVPGRQLKLVDLGTEYTQELKEDIYTGAFEKAVVGGYLTLNDHVYIFAHPDYWYNTGRLVACNTHHMLVIPATYLGEGMMNLTATTDGGYLGCDMYAGHEDTTDPENPVYVDGALQAVIDIIKNDFGDTNLLLKDELFSKTVSTGSITSWDWASTTVDIPSEIMVYGSSIWSSTPSYDSGMEKTQIKLFAERPDLINIYGKDWWLRNIVNANRFASVNYRGQADRTNANTSLGIRPVFAIKGAPPETRTKKRKG